MSTSWVTQWLMVISISCCSQLPRARSLPRLVMTTTSDAPRSIDAFVSSFVATCPTIPDAWHDKSRSKSYAYICSLSTDMFVSQQFDHFLYIANEIFALENSKVKVKAVHSWHLARLRQTSKCKSFGHICSLSIDMLGFRFEAIRPFSWDIANEIFEIFDHENSRAGSKLKCKIWRPHLRLNVKSIY